MADQRRFTAAELRGHADRYRAIEMPTAVEIAAHAATLTERVEQMREWLELMAGDDIGHALEKFNKLFPKEG